MSTTTKSVNDFKLLDPGTLSEPYEYWSALRQQAPIHHVDEGLGFTIISRYEDVVTAVKDTDTFSSTLSRRFPSGMSQQQDSPAVHEVMTQGCPYMDALAFSDGDLHARHRQMVRKGFTVARVRELDELIRDIVADLLDETVTSQEVNFWEEFCIPLPIRVIAHILGVDRAHADDVKRWADAQVARFGQPRESEEENLEIARNLVEFHQHLYRELRARRESPRDDFLSDMVAASEGITENEMVIICAQLLVAGAESTTSLIGSLVNLLLDDPARMQQLRDDPDLIPNAVEEALRLESPIKMAYRFVTKDVELNGQQIPEGTVALLFYASANRDEEFWSAAEEWDLSRSDARRHLAFGYGAHLCLGAELARSEARAALTALLERTSSIERAPGHDRPHHPANLTVRALDQLWVVLEPVNG